MRLIAWQVREVPDFTGMQRIENGEVMERPMIRQLEDEGWEVVESQTAFEIRQPLFPGGPRKRILSGKLDGKIRIGDQLEPFDTKDTSPFVFDRVETEADLLESPWTRKWLRQVWSYALGYESERGWLILGSQGRRKAIPVHLDYERAEEILELCTWAVALAEGLEEKRVDHETIDQELAERDVPYHHEFSICQRCPFRDRACFPPEPELGSAQVRTDLEEAVTRYLEIRKVPTEYKKLQQYIKAETSGYSQTVAGEFVIEGELRTRRLKARPAEPARTSEFWRFDVRKVGERDAGDAEETR